MSLKIPSKSRFLWLGDSHKVEKFSSGRYFHTASLGLKGISLIFFLRNGCALSQNPNNSELEEIFELV